MKRIGNALFTELAWLLGSWAFSLLVLGRAIGYEKLLAATLDIQMHNTYFVLSPLILSIPLLTVTMVVQTGLRRFLKKSQSRFTGWLFGISLLITLSISVLATCWTQ